MGPNPHCENPRAEENSRSAVRFELAQDGRVVISNAGTRAGGRRGVGRFERLRGSAGPGMTTDEIMRLMRGDD